LPKPHYGHGYWDGVGSIIIGLLLAVVALVLINKNRRVLIGKKHALGDVSEVLDVLRADPAWKKFMILNLQ